MDLLGSLGKLVTDPGSLAQEVANAVLPKEISSVVGNAAAGLVDYYTGNDVMAAKHALAAVSDLPQMAGALTKQSSGGTAGFEPSLPKNPTASGTWRGSPTMESAIASLLQQLRGLGFNVTININGTPGQSGPAKSSGATSGDSTSSVAATDSSPASSKSNDAKISADAEKSTSKTSKSDSSKAKADSGPALKALNAMSDADFMKALKSGNIDESIKDDPVAMRAIQARMDAISQMNQLLTSMMQAMHQMQMAVIQNIRV